MMTMQTRFYLDSDLPRLQATVAAWIADAGACGYYHPGNIAHRIYEGFGNGQVRHELVQLWLTGEEIVGFAYHGVFDAGFFVFTCPRYRGRAAERQMVRAASAATRRYLKRIGREDQPVITDVYDCDQPRIDLLTELGFVPYRTWDYITTRPLTAPIPAPRLPDGFTIRGATVDDCAQLAAIRTNTFGGDWRAASYRAQVMQQPGYRPEHELVVVAPDGRFAAFTVIRLDEVNQVGLFEPVGTHSDFRRLGLASALLVHGLRVMQQQGMAWAMIEHAAENLPARDLYRTLGFVKKYETLGFRESGARD